MPTLYQQSNGEVIHALNVDPTLGLSAQEVSTRRKHYGTNQLQTVKPINPLQLLGKQFKDVLVIILLVSATISLLLSFINASGSGEEAKEAILIYLIVVAIAVVGFFNEYKAEKTVEALRSLVGHDARARRDGQVVNIPAHELVPGDIVLLDEGQKVPADLRLLEIKSLQLNEASLTGESEPVTKDARPISGVVPLGDQTNMAFAGTIVATGTAVGLVAAIGTATELGKIAKLVAEIEPEITPLQRKLDNLGKKLGMVILSLCGLVFLVVFFFVGEATDKTLAERTIFAFTAAVALAVAAIPEGLAFVVRISLALGARRMAARNALVRRLSAVEALGSTDIICTDKTGTLTKGEMTVRSLWLSGRTAMVSGIGYNTGGALTENQQPLDELGPFEQTLLVGALCNNAHLKQTSIIGDPTEAALLTAAAKAGISYESLRHEWPRVEEVPFNSTRKMMSTVHRSTEGDFFVATKGAFEYVIKNCTHMLDDNGNVVPLSKAAIQSVQDQNSKMASQALRVLAMAFKRSEDEPRSERKIESGLVFAGLQGIMDPPREEVVNVVRRVQTDAGLRVIMITGDYIETAQAIAREIGLVGEALSGADLDKLSQEEFEAQVEKVSVYARVNPEHKIRIVQALQKCGHQVAMTGDGVNDAPAIKAADIGIAMGITGTDAAKEAADLILLDDQFITIIHAIEEGRGIFDNVRKFVNFLISCNIAEVLVVLTGIVLFQNLLLTAAQLLFINIVTDGLPAIALGSDPAQRNVFKAKPQRFQEAILTRRLWIEIIVFGILMTLIVLWQYRDNQSHGSAATLTAVFVGMVVYEMIRLVDIRTNYRISWFSNPWLSVSVGLSLAVLVAVLYVQPIAQYFNLGPLPGRDWAIIAAGSLAIFVAMKALNLFLSLVGSRFKTS